MDNCQVKYVYTRDLVTLKWPLIREQMEKYQGKDSTLILNIGANDIFPCRKENMHYHFDSRFPCDRDDYCNKMMDLINLAAKFFKTVLVLPPLPRLFEKQCKCRNAAYYPGSLETVTTLTIQLRNTVRQLKDCTVRVVTINQLMKGIYTANRPIVEKWVKEGKLPGKLSIGQLARERRYTRSSLTQLSKDGIHYSDQGYFLIGTGICHLLGHLDGTVSPPSTDGPGGATSH